MFNTPILFLIFNRPEPTKKVFDEIRKQRPRFLFIAADGARQNKEGELEKCKSAQDIVMAGIDWDCEVKILFRDQNLGCGRAVSGAISWFFEHVEMGIILEDDCLPAGSFFGFCEELLLKYKDDCRISTIAGTNLLEKWDKGNASYLFSYHAGIWGWATWRRVWKEYDLYLSNWNNEDVVNLFSCKVTNATERGIYVQSFNKIAQGDVFTWDYQLVFSRITSSRFGIIPARNLITNIGFGSDATNTFDTSSPLALKPLMQINLPVVHPKIVMVDEEYEEKLSSTYYLPPPKKPSILTRFVNKVSHILKPGNVNKR